jgi:hypothetical protein
VLVGSCVLRAAPAVAEAGKRLGAVSRDCAGRRVSFLRGRYYCGRKKRGKNILASSGYECQSETYRAADGGEDSDGDRRARGIVRSVTGVYDGRLPRRRIHLHGLQEHRNQTRPTGRVFQ